MYLLFSGSLVYCFLRVSFGFELLSEPFELAILGLGLVSFAKLMQRKEIKEFKNNTGKQGFINSGPGNPISPDKIRQESS